MAKRTWVKNDSGVWKACTSVWVKVPTFSVGSSQQGGKVAYIGSLGDFTHGMISATTDTSTSIQWGCQGTTIGGDATGTAIGTGQKATTAIVAGCNNASFAAKLCDDLSLNGYTDWFLPSIMELNELYLNKTTIGGFSTSAYWSSSEASSSHARRRDFFYGNLFNLAKYSTWHVRAVRSASTSTEGWTKDAMPYINISGVWKECMNYAECAYSEVGDECGGGKVAYVGSAGDFVNGMISATSDQSTGIEWGCQGTTIGGNATGTAIGTGQKATTAIVAGCNNASFAAKLCDDLSLNGYTDWFLPSRNELNELYQNKDTIGGFSTVTYWWSSSEISSSGARFQHFGYGGLTGGDKISTVRVRAVRGF